MPSDLGGPSGAHAQGAAAPGTTDLRVLIPLLLAAALVLAGCLAGGSGSSEASGSDPGSAATDAPAGADGPAQDGNATQEDTWNATLQEAPPWEVGEWWTVKVNDLWMDKTYTADLVVADRHGDTYELGLAADDFRDALVIAHWPPLGEVDPTTFSFSVHNEPMKLAEFPLEEGDTWDTTYEGLQGFTAEVQSADGATAQVRLTNDNNATVTYTYQAETETVTKLEDFFGRTYEVTDHGTGYEGEVVVPHGRVQYVNGRVLGALGFGGPIFGYHPAPPQGSTRVAEAQASALLLAGSVGVDAGAAQVPPPPGYYRETVTTPGGNTTVLESTGTDGLDATYLHAGEAKGNWEFQHVAGGYGGAATEIVAYEEIRVTLDGSQASTS